MKHVVMKSKDVMMCTYAEFTYCRDVCKVSRLIFTGATLTCSRIRITLHFFQPPRADQMPEPQLQGQLTYTPFIKVIVRVWEEGKSLSRETASLR